MSSKLSEITATVATKTKKVLEDIAKTGGLSVGEVIDRMVMKLSPEDAQEAAMLILDNILITTSKLNQEQLNEAIFKVLDVIGGSFTKNEDNQIKGEISNEM